MLLKLPVVHRIRVRCDSSLLVDVLCMQTSLTHRLLRSRLNLRTRVSFKLESSTDNFFCPNQLTIDPPAPLCIMLGHKPLLRLPTSVTYFFILPTRSTWHDLRRLSHDHHIVTVRLRYTPDSFLDELRLGRLVNWMHSFYLFFQSLSQGAKFFLSDYKVLL